MCDERKWHIGKRKNHGKVPKDSYDCSTFDGYQKMENSIAKEKEVIEFIAEKKLLQCQIKTLHHH